MTSSNCEDLLGDGVDILRELSNAELEILLKLYGNYNENGKLPFHYFSIYNQLRWNKLLENIPDKESSKWNGLKRIFYTHRNGHFAKTGTFVSILKDSLVTSITFHTFDSSLKELKKCLKNTKRIPWKDGPLIEGIHIDLVPFILEFLPVEKSIKIEHSRLSLYFLLDRDVARNLPSLSLPHEYELKSLSFGDETKNYAQLIHSYWPNKLEGSVNFINGMLKLNSGLGVFEKSSNKLVSWVIQNEFYGLGALQTISDHQGKGLAAIVATEMCKMIACKDDDLPFITAFTTSKNYRSQKLLQKLGFKITDYAFWTKYEKSN